MIRVDLDVSRLQRTMQGLTARNIAFAAVNALNATALRVQEAERKNVDDTYEVRPQTRTFVMREAAKITQFANVRRSVPYAEVSVGKKDRFLLGNFESGATRKPFTPGAKSVAVPVTGSPARPSFKASVPKDLRVRTLRFKPSVRKALRAEARKTTLSGAQGDRRTRARLQRAARAKFLRDAANTWQGQQGTYLIPGVGIFQRKAGSRDGTLLYTFQQSPQLKPSLKFVETGRRVANQWLPEETSKAFIKELARARRR